MYFIEKHRDKIAEWSQPENLRGFISNLDAQMDRNSIARKIMAEKDSGRPGHYYGRNIVIEGEIPAAAFAVAPNEFDGDTEWWKDNIKFEAYMRRHPSYSWLNGK